MVNTVSRLNHDLKEFENPSHAIGLFLSKLSNDVEEVLHSIKGNQLDIDNFLSEQGVTGQISLTDQVRTPFKMTDMFAVWNANAFVNPATRTNFAATVNGTVNLPAGSQLTGFDVTLNAGAAQGYTTVVVSGLAGTGGNNLTYQISSPAAGGESVLQVKFPQPLSPATPNGQIGITLTGTANTGNGSIVAYSQGPASVVIQIGQRFFYPNPYAGQFQLVGMTNGMQVLIRDVVSFQVTPPVACEFETIGTADYRKVDRQ